ncbi:MAG: ATP-grasp enzyme-like protein [Nocardioidaceae bacterium]|nr:ATP-grasp enzyme-like protein [Nocardioidaceae bacterium]
MSASSPGTLRPTSPPPAVVVGLDNITGLQTARILAGRGVPVFGVVADRRHFGARTNVCADIIEADLSGDDLIPALRALGERIGRPSVLVPCTDASVSVVSRHRGVLAPRFRLPLSSDDVVEVLMDKVRFARHAAAADLAIPRTEVLTSRDDAEEAARQVSYPCVLKPPVKSPLWLQHTSAKAIPVADADELLSTYEQVAGWSPQLLAQEWVEGGEEGLFSCNCYFDRDGVALATFVARKVRQWPPDIGTSASGEECRDDDVLAETLRVFGSVGFHGLAYLEMKRDARTGRLVIIEPNVGRPTGRSAISEAGGVELVYTAYCDAAGLPLPADREQRYIGTKWLDLRRDAQAAFVARSRGELTVREWVASLRGPKAHAIWSRRDPLPFVVDMLQAVATGAQLASAHVLRTLRAQLAARRTTAQAAVGTAS